MQKGIRERKEKETHREMREWFRENKKLTKHITLTGKGLFKSIRGKVSLKCGISLSIVVGTSLCTADCIRE